MSHQPSILAFAGSLRRDSFNKRLVKIAARAAEDAGAAVTLIDLNDFPLPLFNEDSEKADGTPEHASRLKELMVRHDGFLIASPEYNSSITGVLKNAIDWTSRPAPGEPPLVAFRGKVAGLLAASPGALGGLRGLVHVRAILGNIGVLVLPEQVAVSRAFEAFADDGSLRDAKQQEKAQDVGRRLADILKRLD